MHHPKYQSLSKYKYRRGKFEKKTQRYSTSYTVTVLAIAVCIALVVLPILSLSEPQLAFQNGRVSFVAQPTSIYEYAVVVLLLAAFLQKPMLYINTISVNLKTEPFFAIYLSIVILIAINSLLIGSFGAFSQSIVLLIYSSSFVVLLSAEEHERRKFLYYFSVVLLIFIIISGVLYWPPSNRWMGGIHPNNYAQPLLIFATIILINTRIFRFIGVPLVVFLILSVSSRYALFSIVVLLMIFGFLRIAGSRGRYSPIALAVFFILVLFLLTIGYEFGFVNDVLKLDNRSRGLTSGASGRIDLLQYFVPQLEQRPFTGFGFRQKGEYFGVHNGFLNTVLENGLIIAAMLFFLVAIKYLTWFHRIALGRYGNDFASREQLTGFCIFTMVLVSAVFQPQLINFGDIMGVMMIFSFVFPIGLAKPGRGSSQVGKKSV